MIFESISEAFGERVSESNGSNTSKVYRCPGEGLCERFTGVGKADWTFEQKVEEACKGCGQCEGRGPIDPKLKLLDNLDFSENELKFALLQINAIVEEFHCGKKVNENRMPIWQWQAFVYWINLERAFERTIQIKISRILDALQK